MTVHEVLGLEEGPWTTLCDRIRVGACVPVIGGQLREGLLPLPEAIAQLWATELGYPLARRTELAMVAEFAAQYATDEAELLHKFEQFANKQFAQVDDAKLADGHPYRLLAELPLDLYITTTYDDLIERSLRQFRPPCMPISVSCRWNPEDRWWESSDEVADLTDLAPSRDRPVVFHLHGRLADPPSMVLTEQDHIEFTTKLVADSDQNAQKEPLLPANIKKALARNAWLFVGYGAADRNLRGLIQALATQIGTRDKHAVAVQLQHDVAVEGMEQAADDFLTGYFRRLLLGRKVDVVLTDARTFLGAIRDAVRDGQP